MHSFLFFFFKQNTAYEMRISDWSSDVCSSDLLMHDGRAQTIDAAIMLHGGEALVSKQKYQSLSAQEKEKLIKFLESLDRKSVVSGKSVSVRVDIGGRRIIKQNKTK